MQIFLFQLASTTTNFPPPVRHCTPRLLSCLPLFALRVILSTFTRIHRSFHISYFPRADYLTMTLFSRHVRNSISSHCGQAGVKLFNFGHSISNLLPLHHLHHKKKVHRLKRTPELQFSIISHRRVPSRPFARRTGKQLRVDMARIIAEIPSTQSNPTCRRDGWH
jgi:hypothetical protein